VLLVRPEGLLKPIADLAEVQYADRMIRLETEHLILRPLCLLDAPSIQSVFQTWEIVQWMADAVPWPYPGDGAMTFVSTIALPDMEQGKAWHWSIRPKSDPDHLVGVVSLTERVDNNRGFWIDPAWQGRGFATEASAAATDYWFGPLGKDTLRVPKAIGNTASRRISERQGMKVIRTLKLPFVSGLHDAELWEIDAQGWRQYRRSSAAG